MAMEVAWDGYGEPPDGGRYAFVDADFRVSSDARRRFLFEGVGEANDRGKPSYSPDPTD